MSDTNGLTIQEQLAAMPGVKMLCGTITASPNTRIHDNDWTGERWVQPPTHVAYTFEATYKCSDSALEEFQDFLKRMTAERVLDSVSIEVPGNLFHVKGNAGRKPIRTDLSRGELV